MMMHLEYNHRAEYLKIKPGIQKSKSSKVTDPKQPLIRDSFALPSEKYNTLYITVNSTGFQRMLHTFEP